MSHEGARAPRRWTEPAVVAAAWALLLALARGGPLTFTGVLGWPFASVATAVLALCIGPGLVWWRWLIGGPARHAPAWAFGLGVAWVMVPCTAAMARGASPGQLMASIVVVNGLLSGAFVAERWVRRGAPAASGEAVPRPSLWLIAAVCLVGARLLDLSTRRLNRLTYGGDEWIFMRALRQFVDTPSVAD